MTPKTRYKFKQLITIGIGWLLIGLFFALYDLIVFDYPTSSYILYLPADQSLLNHMLLSLSPPLIGGLVGAPLIVFFLREKLKSYSYGRLLIFHAIIYITIIILVAAAAIFLNSSIILKKPIWETPVVSRAVRLLLDYGIWKGVIFWFLVAITTVFLLEVNDKYGPGVLKNFILGKYHAPRKEYRIFMFLDLKNSTTIAEQIGSDKYFLLLKSFFEDATEALLNTRGEIYQYVGDEITISWKVKDGKSTTDCLDCFFYLEAIINEKRGWYEAQFGTCPEFKAGIHSGLLTVGELGIIKKEIVFSGDVLNTTARLMQKCNDFGVSLLVSHHLLDKLETNNYHFEEISATTLKGKSEILKIYTVEKSST